VSTKIYNGIRIPKSKIEHFQKWFYHECIRQAAKHTASLACAFKKKVVKEKSAALLEKSPDLKCTKGMTLAKFIKNFDMQMRVSMAFKTFVESSKKQWASYNIDCFAHFWPRGKYCYIVPVFPGTNRDTEMKYPPYVEEYGYWNNTDRPENLTNRQWETRRKNWDCCIDPPDWDMRMTIEPIKAGNLIGNGLFTIEKKLIELGYMEDLQSYIMPSMFCCSGLLDDE